MSTHASSSSSQGLEVDARQPCFIKEAQKHNQADRSSSRKKKTKKEKKKTNIKTRPMGYLKRQ